ncbi:hypothetical protein [Myroides odoratus]|uniref:Uncharacterized protein n=1 Tax=Myroides odoratus TaxID=256 RepID=A0A378RNQ5_MYROD|nr:hypothetical protein [Myroides odoratus]QQU04237.1 hypothetical protein I6I89_02835 [Myroides odoratus]STZ28348.1 Uncharacterised protein [Myroides odoratus]
MYLIDLVYRTVLTIANSEVRGNVKPSDIRLLINTTVEEIYESYFYELNRMLNRQNKGLVGNGLDNIPDLIRDKINHYLQSKEVSLLDSKITLPSDVRYLDDVFVDEVGVELLKSLREFQVVKNTANKTYPIGYKIDANTIVVYPNGYNEAVLSYLRKPKVPNWTYFVVNGTEVFNPDANDFQDLDIHQSEVSNVIIKTLQKVGINLKEQDLQAVMTQQQNIEFNQEMQS